MPKPSGSENRQRTRIMTIRVTPQEADMIRKRAQTLGQSVGAMARASLLHGRLRPSRLDVSALVQVRGELASLVGAVNKIGSNFNQFAREANRGRQPQVDAFSAQWDEFKTMFDRDMAELRIACLQAIGVEPHREDHQGDEEDD